MVEKINNLIEKFGLYQAIKLFGGFKKFKKIVESQPELTQYLDEFKGSCSVSLVNTPDAYFNFYILNVDILDDDFAELTVDMVVDFKNLSGEEIYKLKQWLGAVAGDHGFEIYDVGNLPSPQNLFIKSFNGRPYNWPGYDDVISDQEAIELLDKTGKWEGMIREEKSLRDTIKNILKEESDNPLNKKVRHTVEKLGFDKAVKMFGGNLDVIKQAYQDNPLSFLDQFNNLTPVKKGEVLFYRDENGKPLFAYYQDDAYLGKGIVNIDNDRIWEFFGKVLGYDWDEIQLLLKVWLSEVYGLDDVKPLRAYQISDY